MSAVVGQSTPERADQAAIAEANISPSDLDAAAIIPHHVSSHNANEEVDLEEQSPDINYRRKRKKCHGLGLRSLLPSPSSKNDTRCIDERPATPNTTTNTTSNPAIRSAISLATGTSPAKLPRATSSTGSIGLDSSGAHSHLSSSSGGILITPPKPMRRNLDESFDTYCGERRDSEYMQGPEERSTARSASTDEVRDESASASPDSTGTTTTGDSSEYDLHRTWKAARTTTCSTIARGTIMPIISPAVGYVSSGDDSMAASGGGAGSGSNSDTDRVMLSVWTAGGTSSQGRRQTTGDSRVRTGRTATCTTLAKGSATSSRILRGRSIGTGSSPPSRSSKGHANYSLGTDIISSPGSCSRDDGGDPPSPSDTLYSSGDDDDESDSSVYYSGENLRDVPSNEHASNSKQQKRAARACNGTEPAATKTTKTYKSPRSQLVSMLDKISTVRKDKHRIDFLLHASTSIENRMSREEHHIAKSVNMCLMAQAFFLATFVTASMAGGRQSSSIESVLRLVRIVTSILGFSHVLVTVRYSVSSSKATLSYLNAMKRSVDDEIRDSYLAEDGGNSKTACSSPSMLEKGVVEANEAKSSASRSSYDSPWDGSIAYEALLVFAIVAWILIWIELLLAFGGSSGRTMNAKNMHSLFKGVKPGQKYCISLEEVASTGGKAS